MIVKRVVRYGSLLAAIVLPVPAVAQNSLATAELRQQDSSLTADIDRQFDRQFAQFDEKVKDVENLVSKLSRQFEALSPNVRREHLRRLDSILNDLARIPDTIEKDIAELEGRMPEQFAGASSTNSRRKLDAARETLTRIRKGFNSDGDFGILTLFDGRNLFRRGPIELLCFSDPGPCPRRTFTLTIYEIDTDGELIWANLVEYTGAQWKDLDIQISPDWQQIGVYRRDRTGVWFSEFWRREKDSYERSAGPANQAPPSPRRLK